MKKVPFVTLNGNALAINREDEDQQGSVEFRAPGGIWTENTAKYDQVTFALKILGADCDVDNFLIKTRSNINDLMAAQVKAKVKKMAHAFDYTCVYGNSDVSNEFDGFHELLDDIASTDLSLHMGTTTTGAALSLATLDKAIDNCRAGFPDIILMNKNIRRRLTQYLRTVGSYQTVRDEYGNEWESWQGIPFVTTDWLLQTETISGDAYALPTGGACSSIFVVHFGENEGVVGLQSGGIETEVWEKLETKDASRTRVKWYVGLAQFATKSIVRIDGITDAVATA
jgi:hypothetical protein